MAQRYRIILVYVHVFSAIRLPGDKDVYAKEFFLDESMKQKVDISQSSLPSLTSIQLDVEITSSVHLNTMMMHRAIAFNDNTFKTMKVLFIEIRQLAIAARVRTYLQY